MASTITTPKKFSMQQVFEVLLRKTTDKSIIGFLEDVKSTGLEKTAELVYPTGGRGNVYVGGGFSHSTRAKLNITIATWNTEILAIQNGTEVATGATEVTEKEEIEPSSTGAYFTRFKAEGDAGSEIGFVYQISSDGTIGKKYAQGTTAQAGVFTYSTSTKVISFSTGDLALLASDTILCAYTRKTETNAQLIEASTDGIPPIVLVTAYGLAKDVCTGELFPAVIEGTAQVDPNYTFDLASDGDPAVQSLGLEFVKTCRSKKLYNFVVYTDEIPS